MNTIVAPYTVSRADRYDAVVAYCLMSSCWVAGFPLPLLNLVAALVFWLLMRGRSGFVRFHAYQSLLSQVPISLLNAAAVASLALLWLLGWHPLWLAFWGAIAVANCVYLVVSIVAAVQAHAGKLYRMPLFGAAAARRCLS